MTKISVEIQVLEEINEMFTKLNQRCEDLLRLQLWLLHLESDIVERKRIPFGVV